MNYRFFSLFIVLCSVALLLLFVNNWVLISDDVYYDAFGEQLSFEKINELIDLNKKWSWVMYPITPVLYLTKFLLIVVCLSVGVFLYKKEIQTRSLFKIVLLSEFIFLLPSFIKLIWFTLVDTSYSLIDLQNFAPLSFLNLFDRANLEAWAIYPLSLLNLFEVVYVLVLSYLFALTSKSPFGHSLKLVTISYGSGLIVWVVFVMFISVSLTA